MFPARYAKITFSPMFSSNLTKFFAAFALIFTLFSGCRLWQNTGNSNSSSTPQVSDDLKSEIPFSTKEPEQFQAEIVVTTGETESRRFIARDGARRRYDFNFGAANQLTSLQADKNYLMLPAAKIYTENTETQTGETDDWMNFLTTEWLSAKRDASFEKLESVENLTKYRVRLNESDASEIFIYVDQISGLPIKQEFFAIGGDGQKNLAYSFELKNLKLETDENLFNVPADFKKVGQEEFRKILRGENK